MAADPEFSRKLDTVMKSMSISRGRLAQESGLDKSLIGRWVSGTVRPSSLNLERVTLALARRSPGFSMLDWDRPLTDFVRQFGGIGRVEWPEPGRAGLLLHHDVLNPARAQTSQRGDRYSGHYWIHRKSFGWPGRQARLAMSIQPRDGLLELWEGAPGFEYRGWGLLLTNRLYCMFTDDAKEVMAYMITNAARPPKAQVLHAVFLGVSSDGQLTPKSAPAVLVRAHDLVGDRDADAAIYASMKAEGGFYDRAAVPTAIQAFLDRDFGPRAFAEGGPDMVTAPPTLSDEMD
ncbi:MAG: helix-turn-helix transcriptional regulator [bacterium]